MAEDFQGFEVCGEAWWPHDLASRTFFAAGDISGCVNNRNDDVRTAGSTTSGDSGGRSSFDVQNPQTAAAGNPSAACWSLIESPPITDDWKPDFLHRSEEIYSDMMQEDWSEFAAHSSLLQAPFADEFHPVQTLSPSLNPQMNAVTQTLETLTKTKPPTDYDTLFWKSMMDANVQTNFLRSSLTTKKHGEECDDFASEVKRIINEHTVKRARLETPSPLPTFKVRKEKLGDRITALQQLVSPFGKTDTASVLHEAIEYIKFLHDQVNVFSSSYLKDGFCPLQHQKASDPKSKDQEGPMQDLKSRGLCLMPVSSIFPDAAEASGDYFWTPAAFSSFIR